MLLCFINIVRWPVSRVLSRAIIRLAMLSLTRSSNLPSAGGPETVLLQCKASAVLFGLASNRVCPATRTLSLCGELLPRRFTLTQRAGRFIFCDTFHRVTPPRRYLVLCLIRSPDFPPWVTPQRSPHHLTRGLYHKHKNKSRGVV